MRVDAVIVNFNGGPSLLRCLESLRAADVGHVVVVDNASTDASATAINSADPEVDVVFEPKNLGYGTAANRGAMRGNAPYVLIANPDVSFGADAVDRLVAALDRFPDAAAAGPRIVDVEGHTYPSARAFPDFVTGAAHALLGLFVPKNRWSKRYRSEEAPAFEVTARDSDWVSGACIVFRRVAFESVGGFDERYFMYVEDLDVCWRLGRAGWRVVFEPAAVVTHDQGLSTRHHAYRMLAAHHASTLRFARKSMSGPMAVLVPIVACGLVVRFCLAVVRELLSSRRRGGRVGHG